MHVPHIRSRKHYLMAAALCALTAAIAMPLRDWLDPANIAMLFLLAVFIAAIRLGRGPAVMSAFLSVALFDFFFVQPQHSLSVADAQYLVTFAVMLAVGLFTSHQAAQLAEKTEAAQARECETRQLYEVARELGAALSIEQAVETLERFLADQDMEGALVIAESLDANDPMTLHGERRLDTRETDCAREVYDSGVGIAADLPAGIMLFLPLTGATRMRGVLAVGPRNGGDVRARRPLLEALASLVGIAVERLHFAAVAQQSELAARTEKLRSSILSAISHDLRTPLTSLVGLADSLAERQAELPTDAAETAGILRDQAQAMHRLLSNLLELARLRSGRLALNLQWQPFEEIVGSSLRLLGDLLAQRRLAVDLPADLPLLRFDAVLMERVLCNLLENAVKYSAPGAAIHIAGNARGERFELCVCNAGAGFPADPAGRIFELFERGDQEPAVPGTGIGLAVSRAIVVAHGGTIAVENPPGQACVRITLPLGTPPTLEGEA
ncbi:MAG: DUF4118 domain-containing protein [Pseudomonadota bacterium]